MTQEGEIKMNYVDLTASIITYTALYLSLTIAVILAI